VLASGAAVLNADEPQLVEMAELSDGSVVFYSLQADNAAIAAHRAAQGRAVFLRDRQILLAEGAEEQLIGRIDSFPLTRADAGRTAIASLLAAIGAARALGVSAELIAAGLKTYER
jgi:cyanophycin synthetase